MNTNYRSFFGMTREPFHTDLSLKDILETPDIAAIKKRFDYTLRLGAIAIVTGEAGSGKCTALRYVVSKLHPSEYRTVWITACSGSILKFYRLLLAKIGIHMAGPQKAIMIGLIQKAVREIVAGMNMKIALVVDEASPMRLEVLPIIPSRVARLGSNIMKKDDAVRNNHKQSIYSEINTTSTCRTSASRNRSKLTMKRTE